MFLLEILSLTFGLTVFINVHCIRNTYINVLFLKISDHYGLLFLYVSVMVLAVKTVNDD